MDYDRIYDSLERANATLAKQGETLATISQAQCDMKERLFGFNGQPGIVSFLQGEIAETQKTVADHSRKFNYYKGAAAILAVVWAGIVSLVAAVIGHHVSAVK